MQQELEKVDLIRERTGVSYKDAKEALDEAGGDLVQALIHLEGRDRSVLERVQERGHEVVGQVKTYVKKGTHRKIKIKKGDRTLFEVPASVGALGVVGALLAPEIAVIGVIGAIAAKINVELTKKDSNDQSGEGNRRQMVGLSQEEKTAGKNNDDI